MIVVVFLVDAFEHVTITLPERTVTFFTREAIVRAEGDLAALLSGKTVGLTAHQLEAARKHGEDISAYVLRWILARPHEVAAPIEIAPPPEPLLEQVLPGEVGGDAVEGKRRD